MQVLHVEGFEERVVYNASKSYVGQLGRGVDYPVLNDVYAVTICDFVLFEGQPEVPLVSRWCMTEQSTGRRGLKQVQYVFMELRRYTNKDSPRSIEEQWAWLFREAARLSKVPAGLAAPVRRALEVARTSGFTEAEWEADDRCRIGEQDARGAIAFAHQQGRQEGRQEGIAIGEERGMALARAAALFEARETLWESAASRGWSPSAAERAAVEAEPARPPPALVPPGPARGLPGRAAGALSQRGAPSQRGAGRWSPMKGQRACLL